MASVLTVRDDARRELIEARDYYDEQRRGYGERFIEAVEREFSLLLKFEKIGKPVGRGVRSCAMTDWPYSIVYITRRDELFIVAIAHDRRRPGYWRSRLR